MRRNLILLVLLSWLPLASLAGAGSLTLTVPDAKDAVIVQARDLYNARTGQSLTTRQFVAALVRHGIAAELALERQRAADAEVEAARRAAAELEEQKARELDDANRAEDETAWGLPATPRPTPVPTPTVPVLEEVKQ